MLMKCLEDHQNCCMKPSETTGGKRGANSTNQIWVEFSLAYLAPICPINIFVHSDSLSLLKSIY